MKKKVGEKIIELLNLPKSKFSKITLNDNDEKEVIEKINMLYEHIKPSEFESRINTSIIDKNDLSLDDVVSNILLPDIADLNHIIYSLSNNIFIISEEMETKKRYKEFKHTILKYLRFAFEIKGIRERPVYFKFFNKDGSSMYRLQLRHFYTNLLFWEPLMKLDSVENLDEDMIFDCSNITRDTVKAYIDKHIVIPFKYTVPNKEMNSILSDTIHNLSKISTDFNIILGMSMNIESLINLADRNPRFNEIIRTKIDESLQPTEVEKLINDLTNEEIQILMNEDNVFKPLLRSGSGIKEKQLSESTINGGLKPDLMGNTIPIIINSNLIVGGYNNVINYTIDSIGGRKSLILNKYVMGKSGYFARKVSLLGSTVNLSKTTKCCDTVHPVKIEIKSKKYLDRFKGRQYRLPHQIVYNTLKGDEIDLIGRELFFRSPVTCACTDGICHECYGRSLANTNVDISVGAFASAYLTNPISQSILSSKHILTTISENIAFNKEFDKFFIISGNEIVLNSQNEDISDYSLVILTKDIVFIDEFIDDSDIDSGYNKFINTFSVRNNKTGEIIDFCEVDNKDLYLTKELTESMKIKSGKNVEVYKCDLTDLPETGLFLLEINNNELTKPLYNIMNLLDAQGMKSELDVNDVNSLVQKMDDLLIESKINIQSVHAEVILSALIRKKSNPLERPDFSKYNAIKDYSIFTISKALEHHPSPLIGFSFQYLSRQLINPKTFEKNRHSFIDAFFKEKP